MSRPALTPRQRLILDTIHAHTRNLGYPPSVREIGAAVGLTSTSSVHHHLQTLEANGYLRRTAGRCRAVVLESAELGQVAA